MAVRSLNNFKNPTQAPQRDALSCTEIGNSNRKAELIELCSQILHLSNRSVMTKYQKAILYLFYTLILEHVLKHHVIMNTNNVQQSMLWCSQSCYSSI